MISNAKAVIILLRLSIASVFIYAAVGATLQPENWLYFLPDFATNIIPANILLLCFSAFQAILSVWILTGWKPFYAGILTSFTLIAVILANLSALDVLFRDFAILFAALALTLASKQKKS